jgi:hypothetical protein
VTVSSVNKASATLHGVTFILLPSATLRSRSNLLCTVHQMRLGTTRAGGVAQEAECLQGPEFKSQITKKKKKRKIVKYCFSHLLAG